MLSEEELKQLEDAVGPSRGAGYISTGLAYRLFAEIQELRLVLRDAVQDNTLGNRVWRAGVKAGLEAAAKSFYATEDEPPVLPRAKRQAWLNARGIRAIDPDSILPGD